MEANPPQGEQAQKFNGSIAIVVLLLGAVLVFTNLGHYALWDDEANTALIGEGVWRTGDTSAFVGKNLVAYQNGVELSNLKERYVPPAQYYIAAPFVGLWPGSAFAARLPFACIGMTATALLLWWIYRLQVSPLSFLLTAMALVGSASWWLYLRQCRYYSAAMFFSIAIAYVYYIPSRRWWTLTLLVLLSLGLLTCNYLDYAALYAVLAVDWWFWSRRRFPISFLDALQLFLPQIILGGFIISIWDPLDKHVFGGSGTSFSDRILLFWWAWRDLNRCEFGSLLVLGLAPLVALWCHDRILLRMFTGLFVYIVAIVALTPQNPALPFNRVLQPVRLFDVRYLAPGIPLILAISVLTISRLFHRRKCWTAILAGALAFGTNVLNGGSLVGSDAIGRPAAPAHSAIVLFIGELIHRYPDPYSLVVKAINSDLVPGRSICVLPNYMTYSLMFHAPGFLYAWQLPHNPPAGLQGLNPILYSGRVLPDYVILFGPEPLRLNGMSQLLDRASTRKIATIDFYWHDLYRPELAWRLFEPVRRFRRDTEAIQIFRLRSSTAKGDD